MSPLQEDFPKGNLHPAPPPTQIRCCCTSGSQACSLQGWWSGSQSRKLQLPLYCLSTWSPGDLRGLSHPQPTSVQGVPPRALQQGDRTNLHGTCPWPLWRPHSLETQGDPAKGLSCLCHAYVMLCFPWRQGLDTESSPGSLTSKHSDGGVTNSSRGRSGGSAFSDYSNRHAADPDLTMF